MVKIQIKGRIVSDSMGPVYDFLKMPATYPKEIADALPETNEDVEVEINSGGGLVDAGSEIYTALRNYQGHVKVNVVGTAASAASVIAMAGDEVVMSPVAQMMIHNAQAGVAGDNRDHAHMAEILENTNHALASAYVAKTGMNEADVLDMMNKTTYLTAEQAVDKGFADKIMFDDGVRLTASVDELLTEDQLEAARGLMNQVNKPQPPTIHPTTDGISGHGLANAYIKADGHDGKLLVDGHSDAQGNFNLKHKLNPGDEVRVTQADDNGTSKPAVANVPGGKPDPKADNISREEFEAMRAELNQLKSKQTANSNWKEPFFIA